MKLRMLRSRRCFKIASMFVDIHQLREKLDRREISVVQVVQSCLDRIETLEPILNAFITVTGERARARAARIDQDCAQGSVIGRLAGVPVAIKDIILTKGVRTTAGSKILANYIPPYRATVVEKLLAQDAVVVGKTNCDEFAMGASGENSAYGPTLNPWDTSRVTGGSSSGSAASVAAGECLVALGSDTGGSIRQPAAFCGVVGLKPTYGRVSRYGLISMASSLDSVGVFSRTVQDAAQVLEAVAGHDPFDATSSREPVPAYLDKLTQGIKGLRVGIPKEFFAHGLNGDVEQAVRQAIDSLRQLGAELIEVSLPSMPYALAAYYILCPSEVSANLARYDGVRFGTSEPAETLSKLYTATRGKLLGTEVKRRIMLGTYVLSAGYYDAYYRTAQKVRNLIKADFASVFKQVDVLATPVTPDIAFKLGEKTADPLAMYLEDIFTVPVNIAGIPAISLPCGQSRNMPIGLQLIGPWLKEATLFRAAHAFEQATDWHKLRPTLVSA